MTEKGARLARVQAGDQRYGFCAQQEGKNIADIKRWLKANRYYI